MISFSYTFFQVPALNFQFSSGSPDHKSSEEIVEHRGVFYLTSEKHLNCLYIELSALFSVSNAPKYSCQLELFISKAF